MGLKNEIKSSAIFLCLMLFFMTSGLLFLSLFEEEVIIAFDWGSGNYWTTGWHYDYDWVGGLGNWSLAIGLSCAIASFLCFIGFVINLIKLVKKLSIFTTSFENNDPNSTIISEKSEPISFQRVSISDKLDKLILLKAKGVISEEEFEQFKQRLINENLNEN